MSFEFLGIKSVTIIPAFGGAVAYALRAAEETWPTRLTIGGTGFITALFAAPPVVVLTEQYFLLENLTSGITFTVGAFGGLLVGILIGILKLMKSSCIAGGWPHCSMM